MTFSRFLLLSFYTSFLSSCSEYPIYKTYTKGRLDKGEYSLMNSADVVVFDLQAVQTKSGENKVIDTPLVAVDKSLFSIKILENISHELSSDQELKLNFVPFKFPIKRSIPKYIDSFDVKGNRIILFPTYRYSVSDEREGGGGLGLAEDNGYQRHNITHALHIAIYQDSQLVYSDNAVRFEQIRTLKGEKINHTFPSEIADELLQQALSTYMERMK